MEALSPLGIYVGIIGENLRHLREEAKLTTTEVADAIGVSQTGLSRIELGQGLPRLDTVAKLAYFYGVDFDEILGVSDPEILGALIREVSGG